MYCKRALTFAVAAFTLTLSGCLLGNEPVVNNSRKVKYEISGNFSGTFIVVYTSPGGGNWAENNVTVGWSAEVEYPSSTMAIGVGAQSSTIGSPGQAAVIKIFVEGKEVKSSSATAGSLGEMMIPTISYSL